MSGQALKNRSQLVLLYIVALLAGHANLSAQTTKSDIAQLTVFRPATNVWLSRSQSESGSYTAIRLGSSTDIRVPADFDGDGETDNAVWKPETGVWNIRLSSTGKTSKYEWGTTHETTTGLVQDIPVAADYDGDGNADIAFWRPETGVWHILSSSKGYDVKRADRRQLGKLGDIPVVADYDGDGMADAAVFRYWENNWYILESSTGDTIVRNFGSAGEDKLVPADYTGDGKADIAVYRRGTWFIRDSKTGETDTFQLGFENSIPVPADYDGDGVTDLAVYQEGTWYVYESGTPRFQSHNFGLAGDLPLASLGAKPSIIGLP